MDAVWQLSAEDVVHRIGGSEVANLRLKEKETTLNPPGISVFAGGTPEDAVRQLTEAFPHARRLHILAQRVGSAAVAEIREAGFDVIADPTQRFDNHARLTHPDGAAGFSDDNLAALSDVFSDTETN